MNLRSKTRIIVFGLLACLSANASAADNWPTWRGPEGTGVAPQGNPPVTWSETENVKWKIDIPGVGTSSPIIWEDKLFFQTAVPTQEADVFEFDVVCLNRKTGQIIWQQTARRAKPHEGHHRDHGYASYSPITNGTHIWANFGSRGLHCFDMDGNLKWSRDLMAMETRSGFGEGSSAALAGDNIVVVLDHEGQSAIFAFDKDSGEPLWRKDREERTAWATPVAVEVDGRMQVIANATTFIRSYDARSGDIIWQCTGQTQNVIPTPVLGFGMVFCTSGFRGSALQAIRLGRTGDLTGSDAIAWQVDDATPYVPSPLLYGENLYVCSGNNAILSCYQAKTGQPNYVKQRLGAIKGVYASPVGAAGRVYVVGRNGVTIVLKNAATLEVLATNTLDDGFDASAAIATDALYLKGRKHLYCLRTP